MRKTKSNLPADIDIQEGQDVFISYSRADQEWVRWLSAQFVSAGREPWVDWQGIKPGEKWWPAILQGIDAANAFVFVLSPDSVQSKVCKQEIDRAVESGKRIVPLVCRGISGLEIHPGLKELNYIFLRSEEEQTENLPKLFEALDTDLEHVRAHSRFGVRAREWEAKGKSSAFLLRGGALEDAIQWQALAPGKLPVPTPLQTELIQTSRKAARRRQRLTTGAITGGLFVAVGLALLAIEQRNAATTERDRAEQQTREARIQAGKGHVLRGNIHPTSSDRVFYNARAVGFAGLGKPHPAGEDSDERAKPSASDALREVRLDIQEAWNRTISGKSIRPAPADQDKFPILLAGKQAEEEAAKAYHEIALAPSQPFLWTSPVASQHSGVLSRVAWSPDGQILASGSWDRNIKLWDAESGREMATLAGHSDWVHDVAWSPDGQTLASCSRDKSIKLWDVASGKEKATLTGHTGALSSVAWSPDGQTLASGSDDKSIKLWDVASGQVKATLTGHSGDVYELAWSPDGQTLASSSDDNSIKLWNAGTGQEEAILAGHSDYVGTMAWSPDGQTLASGSGDNSIKLWDVGIGKEKATLAGHSGAVNSVAWSPDGQTLASGLGDTSINLYDVATGKGRATLRGHTGPVNSVAWSPDSQTLASGSGDGSIKLWDAGTGKEEATLMGHLDSVLSVAWSPDGQTLASGSDDQSIKLWDVASGQEKATLAGHLDSVGSVSWSPNGETLASGSDDKTIKLWDVASGQEESTLAEHSNSVWSVAWSPDGQILASGSDDQSIKLWDVASGQEKATLAGHSDCVYCVSWSPDGQTLASGSEDCSIKLWDVASGEEKSTLTVNSGPVNCVGWSPDGQTLAGALSNASIKLWEATVIVRRDLYVYVTEGWCRFDPRTENLQWNEPKRELYRSIETPFRNVPRWSSLGILQRTDLGTDEKHWLLYLKALQAENWAAAALFRGRLSPEQRKIPHASVVWGIRTLADQAVSACKAGLPVLARMRVESALGFLSGLEPVQAERFYVRLGVGFAEQRIDAAQAEPILAALPDDAARAAVQAKATPVPGPVPVPK